MRNLFETRVVSDTSGMSLIELLITLLLLAVAIGLVSFFFAFGNGVFGRGQERSMIQNSVRLASQTITEKVKFASDIDITNSANNSYSNIGVLSGTISIDGTEFGQSAMPGTTYTVTFSVHDASMPSLLEFTITGNTSRESYELTTVVRLLNTVLDLDNLTSLAGPVLRYIPSSQ